MTVRLIERCRRTLEMNLGGQTAPALRSQIETALRRIEEGKYGLCSRCSEPIAGRRLAQVPWTPFCLRCQRELEQGVSGN